MSAKPVQVSIDLELLRRIDADPETRKKGRSAFVRSAVSHYLDARRRRETDAAIRTAAVSRSRLEDASRLPQLPRPAPTSLNNGTRP